MTTGFSHLFLAALGAWFGLVAIYLLLVTWGLLSEGTCDDDGAEFRGTSVARQRGPIARNLRRR